MPGLPNISVDNWPTWLLFLFILINIFKQQLAAFVPQGIRDAFNHWAARRSDRQEHAQGIETAILDSKLQTAATEQLRASWREDKIFEMIHDKDSYLYDYFDGKLDGLKSGQDKQTEILSSIHRTSIRTNDLLTVMNQNLTTY